MRFKYIFLIQLLSFQPMLLFSMGMVYQFHVINSSSEEIFLTMLSNTAFREQGQVEYKNDFDSGMIRFVAWGEIIKMNFVPGKDDRILSVHAITTVRNKELIDITPTGAEIINTCFETFIICDSQDNILMTIHDLNKNSFSDYDGYPGFLNITQEIIDEGRKKYVGKKMPSAYDFFIPGEIDVEIVPSQNMIQIDNPVVGQFFPQYTFTDKDNDYQIRYFLLKQTANDMEYIRILYMDLIVSFICSFNRNAVRSNRDFLLMPDLDSKIRSEYNGDLKNWVNISDPNLDISAGYRYIMVNAFYKFNRGIVVQAILYNNQDFFQKYPHVQDIIHSFKFRE